MFFVLPKQKFGPQPNPQHSIVAWIAWEIVCNSSIELRTQTIDYNRRNWLKYFFRLHLLNVCEHATWIFLIAKFIILHSFHRHSVPGVIYAPARKLPNEMGMPNKKLGGDTVYMARSAYENIMQTNKSSVNLGNGQRVRRRRRRRRWKRTRARAVAPLMVQPFSGCLPECQCCCRGCCRSW